MVGYSKQENVYVRKNQKMWHIGLLDVPKSIAGVTIMKMMHEEVGIRRRYVCHKEMCIWGEIKMLHFGHSDSNFTT